VSGFDKIEQFGFGTEPRRDAAFLIKLAEIVVIVRVVAHRFPPGCFVCWWKPQGCETRLRDNRQFRFEERPPRVLVIFHLGTIPIKGLQHDTHNSPSFFGVSEHRHGDIPNRD